MDFSKAAATQATTPATPLPPLMLDTTTSSPAFGFPAKTAATTSMPLQRKLQQLRYAAWENDLAVIKDLLQSIEDDGDAFDSGSESIECDFGESVQQNNSHNSDFGFGPLHCAASMGNVEMLHSILAANVCDVDEPDKDGNTALMWAISYASADSASASPATAAGSFDDDLAKRTEMELVEALIDSGANVNKVNYEGETPLFAAVKLGSVEKVAFLLENGADPNIHDLDGATCLHHAASLGLDSIAAVLLRNGAFLNQPDEWEECALHWAVREGGEGAMRIVKMLAEHGAVLDIYNEDNETPLDLAVETGDDRMVQLLLSLGAMGSGFDSMTIADDCDDDDCDAGVTANSTVFFEPKVATSSANAHHNSAFFEEKATPGLLAWTAEASQVMRACEQSLTHLVA